MSQKKVVVSGASGLVGNAAIRHFLAEGWSVVGVSRRKPEGIANATHVSVDLRDAERCREVFGALTDVTHLCYAAVWEKPNLIEGWRDREQMETNLAMLRNLFEPLEAAARLEHVSLLQGTKAYGVHIEPFPVPARERWPRHPHENFYWLQEDFLRERQPGKAWNFIIFRPQLIFGEAVRGNLNVLPAIGVYAALLKERGEPLYYPGGASFVFEAVDTDLLAHALRWAAEAPDARGETFNITNGDVFHFENVWPVIAEALGMQPGPRQPVHLAEELPKREAEWAAIVAKYGLRAPTSLHDFLGESAQLADFSLLPDSQEALPPVIVSTIKLRQAGFHECMDTEDMLRKWIRHYQAQRLLPPR